MIFAPERMVRMEMLALNDASHRVVAAGEALPPVSAAAIETYSQDFEALDNAIRVDNKSAAGINADIFVINAIGGTDFAAGFNDLKTGFDTLRSELNAFITVFGTHVHTGVTAGSVSSGPPGAPAVPATATIDAAKIEEIKLP